MQINFQGPINLRERLNRLKCGFLVGSDFIDKFNAKFQVQSSQNIAYNSFSVLSTAYIRKISLVNKSLFFVLLCQRISCFSSQIACLSFFERVAAEWLRLRNSEDSKQRLPLDCLFAPLLCLLVIRTAPGPTKTDKVKEKEACHLFLEKINIYFL